MTTLLIDEEYMQRKQTEMRTPGQLNPSVLADVRATIEAGGTVEIDPAFKREHTRKVVEGELEVLAGKRSMPAAVAVDFTEDIPPTVGGEVISSSRPPAAEAFHKAKAEADARAAKAKEEDETAPEPEQP